MKMKQDQCQQLVGHVNSDVPRIMKKMVMIRYYTGKWSEKYGSDIIPLLCLYRLSQSRTMELQSK